MKKIVLLIFLFFSISFYGQNEQFSRIRHTENDFVIPKDLMIVYRGMANELVVDVTNSKSFKVSGNGLTLKEKNIYKLNPGAGLETVVIVDIVLKNNKKVTEKHLFKIRNIKSPISCFNYMVGDSIIVANRSQFKNAFVKVISGDKNLNFTFKVAKFKIHIPGRKTIEINGDKIDDKTFNEINKYVSKSDMITIFDISVKMTPSFSGCILINPILIKVL